MMVTVTILLRKDKLSKSNTAPIHFRLIRGRKTRYISTGISLQPHYWDDANKLIKKGVPNAARMNAYLAKKSADIQSICLDEETVRPQKISVRKLKHKILADQEIDFIKFAYDFVETYKESGQIGSYDKCKGIISKLEEFMAGKPLYFSDFTVEFLHKYQRHLQVVKGNKVNTIHTNLKFFRRIYNAAFERDLVDFSENPFLKFKLKTEKTSRAFLSEEEINKIDGLKLTDDNYLQKVRDVFVWACYAGGIRISDILLLKWENYDGTHVNFTIRKTNQQHSIKLPDRAKEIIEYCRKFDGSTKYIFNLLPRDLDEDDRIAVDRAVSRATASYNAALKRIAKRAEIKKSISSHVSRHSFATRALRRGISLDKVQHILRHQNPAITQIYAKLVNEELDKAMDLLN